MKRRIQVEALEGRRLLSVSASTLLGSLTAGTKHTYQITTGSQSGTSTTVVKGSATFNGHAATEIDGTSSGTSSTSKTYVGFDAAGDAVTFGDTGNSSLGAFTDINTPPAIDFPATMVGGTTYTENWMSTESVAGMTFVSTVKHTVKLTSETKVSVTVPAGTFSAYLFNISNTTTESGFTEPATNEQQWIVPSLGLVKSVVSNSGTTTTTVLVPGIVVGPAAKLKFEPATPTAKVGQAISPPLKVDVLDANGNLVTTNTSTVTLSLFSGPTGGTVGGTLSVSAVGGVATFSNVKLNAAGSYVLQAKDGSLTLAKSNPIVASAAVTASKLAFLVPPGTGTAGKALSPAVTVGVETSGGAIVTSNTSKVTLSIVSGPAGGALSGTVAVNAATGIAKFSNLIFNKVGTYVIKAIDGTLAAATSASFKINVGAAAKLLFLQPPAKTVAGKVITPKVMAEIIDANGNLVTTNTSNVTISIGTGPAGAKLGGTLTVKAVGGIATFSNLVLTKAGSFALKVADGTLTAALSPVFAITAAAASKLVFTQQPTTATHNVTLTPAVKVAIEDAFGNIVLTNATSVILALASGPSGGAISGTLSVHAVAGVATFSSVKLSKAGTYVIKATDGTLTLAKSKNVVVG